MLRQRSDGSSNSRKWNFLHAIFECQIGTVKIDFAKLALKLGYKNERCAQDMYHRFRRAHFPERRGVNNRGNINRTARHVHGKQQFHANGKMIHRKGAGFYRDDEEDLYQNNDDDEDDDDDDNGSGEDRDGEEERPGAGVKVEDADMERAEKDFWGLGIIDLEEWGCGEDGKIKMEPGIKKEPVVEEWVWT